jgi:hypothetical protein
VRLELDIGCLLDQVPPTNHAIDPVRHLHAGDRSPGLYPVEPDDCECDLVEVDVNISEVWVSDRDGRQFEAGVMIDGETSTGHEAYAPPTEADSLLDRMGRDGVEPPEHAVGPVAGVAAWAPGTLVDLVAILLLVLDPFVPSLVVPCRIRAQIPRQNLPDPWEQAYMEVRPLVPWAPCLPYLPSSVEE